MRVPAPDSTAPKSTLRLPLTTHPRHKSSQPYVLLPGSQRPKQSDVLSWTTAASRPGGRQDESGQGSFRVRHAAGWWHSQSRQQQAARQADSQRAAGSISAGHHHHHHHHGALRINRPPARLSPDASRSHMLPLEPCLLLLPATCCWLPPAEAAPLRACLRASPTG